MLVEIVRFCEPSRDKARIMNKWNLNDVQVEAYLVILAQQKLLKQNDGQYVTTERGHQFLASHDQLNRIIET
jgi:predicted transcriptional regulator